MGRIKEDRMFLFFYKYAKLAKDFDLTLEEKKTFFYMICNYGLYGKRPLVAATPRVRTLMETVAEHIRRANKSYEVVQKEKW